MKDGAEKTLSTTWSHGDKVIEDLPGFVRRAGDGTVLVYHSEGNNPVIKVVIGRMLVDPPCATSGIRRWVEGRQRAKKKAGAGEDSLMTEAQIARAAGIELETARELWRKPGQTAIVRGRDVVAVVTATGSRSGKDRLCLASFVGQVR